MESVDTAEAHVAERVAVIGPPEGDKVDRPGSGFSFCLQNWKAIFSATSTAVAPSSE